MTTSDAQRGLSTSRGKGKAKARESIAYRCVECGWSAAKWVGRCNECQAWGTVQEVAAPTAGVTKARSVATPAQPIAEVDAESAST